MQIPLYTVRDDTRSTSHMIVFVQTFLGQKYGYRPFPVKIHVAEFEKLLNAVDKQDDAALLKHWFWRDDNSVPAQYLLQPITSLPNWPISQLYLCKTDQSANRITAKKLNSQPIITLQY